MMTSERTPHGKLLWFSITFGWPSKDEDRGEVLAAHKDIVNYIKMRTELINEPCKVSRTRVIPNALPEGVIESDPATDS